MHGHPRKVRKKPPTLAEPPSISARLRQQANLMSRDGDQARPTGRFSDRIDVTNLVRDGSATR